MSHKGCAVKSCNNRENMQAYRKFKFHGFPNFLKDKNRCIKWIKFCRNLDLEEEFERNPHSLKNYKICSDHFKRRFYNCPQLWDSSSLMASAIPTVENIDDQDLNVTVEAAEENDGNKGNTKKTRFTETCLNITNQFERWEKLRKACKIDSDTRFAKMILDIFMKQMPKLGLKDELQTYKICMLPGEVDDFVLEEIEEAEKKKSKDPEVRFIKKEEDNQLTQSLEPPANLADKSQFIAIEPAHKLIPDEETLNTIANDASLSTIGLWKNGDTLYINGDADISQFQQMFGRDVSIQLKNVFELLKGKKEKQKMVMKENDLTNKISPNYTDFDMNIQEKSLDEKSSDVINDDTARKLSNLMKIAQSVTLENETKLKPEVILNEEIEKEITEKPKRGRRKIKRAKNFYKAYACSNCDHWCTSRIQHSRHMKTFHEEVVRQKNLAMWRQRNQMARQRVTVICHKCGKVCYSKASYYNHNQLVHGEKRFNCPDCDYKTTSSSRVNFHRRTVHTVERSHHCSYCTKTFKRADQRRIHERIHTGEKPYRCHLCPESFIDWLRRKMHLKKVHCITNEQEQQLEEGLAYITEENMDSLEQIKERKLDNEVDLKCPFDYCQFISQHKQNIVSHLQECHDEKRDPKFIKVKCAVEGCDFESTTRMGILNHFKNLHSHYRPYTCTICQKSFKKQSTLTNHFRTHTGEKPYNCRFCNTMFSQQTTCKQHEIKIHNAPVIDGRKNRNIPQTMHIQIDEDDNLVQTFQIENVQSFEDGIQTLEIVQEDIATSVVGGGEQTINVNNTWRIL